MCRAKTSYPTTPYGNTYRKRRFYALSNLGQSFQEVPEGVNKICSNPKRFYLIHFLYIKIIYLSNSVNLCRKKGKKKDVQLFLSDKFFRNRFAEFMANTIIVQQRCWPELHHRKERTEEVCCKLCSFIAKGITPIKYHHLYHHKTLKI